MRPTTAKQDINRRVALALGYEVEEVQVKPRVDGSTLSFRLLRDGLPVYRSTGMQGQYRYPDESWDFCRDPTAADLVRLEIDRRGWTWNMRSTPAGVYWAGVFAGETIADYRREFSAGSPHMALCLAFLAACEATNPTTTEHPTTPTVNP